MRDWGRMIVWARGTITQAVCAAWRGAAVAFGSGASLRCSVSSEPFRCSVSHRSVSNWRTLRHPASHCRPCSRSAWHRGPFAASSPLRLSPEPLYTGRPAPRPSSLRRLALEPLRRSVPYSSLRNAVSHWSLFAAPSRTAPSSPRLALEASPRCAVSHFRLAPRPLFAAPPCTDTSLPLSPLHPAKDPLCSVSLLFSAVVISQTLPTPLDLSLLQH